ncbi:MAG: tRNA-dihydrouridine synthase family protein [Candidatus Micrarchaeia archaeon]
MIYRNYLSPIDGFSNLPFRLLCQKHGADAACVPLVNSAAIIRNPKKIDYVDAHPDERNIGVQVVGNMPEELGLSVRMIDEARPFISWFNINCGCPSVRTMESGGGSAMLAHPEKIARSVAEIRKSTDKPVSVKIRIKDDLEATAGLCRMLEEAGAHSIIIHGRTAKQGYSGRADWELIKALKERLSVPVIGNGDIASAREGVELVAKGYCDSYMVGRAVMANPLFFSGKSPGNLEERVRLIEDYISLHRKYLGEPEVRDLRLKAASFMNGVPGASAVRNRICRSKSVAELMDLGRWAVA